MNMEKKSFYTYVMVGVILHVVLAIANEIPPRCNITVSGNNNIMRIKSLKAGKYLKAELKADGVRTLSFTGNETDCGTFFVLVIVPPEIGTTTRPFRLNFTLSLPGMPDVCLAVSKRKLVLEPSCDSSKRKFLFTSERVYLSKYLSDEPEMYHILTSLRRNRTVVKSSRTGKISLVRYNQYIWKDCGTWVKEIHSS